MPSCGDANAKHLHQTVTSEAPQADVIPTASARLAGLYFQPLSRLFNLGSALDDLACNRECLDRRGWAREVKMLARKVNDEKLALGLIDNCTKTAVSCCGGLRGIVSDAASELNAKAATSYDHDAGVKVQMRNAILVLVERSIIYGVDLAPLNLTADEAKKLKSYVEERMKPKPGRNGSNESEPSGNSQALILYEDPIETLARALAQSDFPTVARELLRLSLFEVGRIERLSREFDRIIFYEQTGNNASPLDSALIRFALHLESERAELIGRAIAGIHRCFGGQRRLSMEFTFRKGANSAIPTDPEAEEILDRLAEEMMTAKSPSEDSDE
jgi:hypothetical protein